MDISWISSQAKEIHTFFVSIFYILATLLLLIGVIVEYFKLPIGGAPAFSQLVGRALVAGILLAAYPEISNTVAAVADAVADKLGSINTIGNVLQSAGAILKDHSWSWTSIGDTLLSVIAYFVYFILYFSVFFFDAAIVYCLILLYIFSPILIAFYILPQTAAMTTGLFRTLFEIASWKIVFSVLGTLLWSTVLHDFQVKGQNFFTLLALTLMLAFSILLTPIVVRNLISGALSSVATQTAGLAAIGLSAGLATPAAMAGLAKAGTAKAYGWGMSKAWQGTKKAYQGAKAAPRCAKSQFSKRLSAKSEKPELKEEKQLSFPSV
ncbi:MAG: hypothetical protein HYX41_05225 [Bdellovibrio sp.]|nr:hypothetical protein [Bdellovibrio sp.]